MLEITDQILSTNQEETVRGEEINSVLTYTHSQTFSLHAHVHVCVTFDLQNSMDSIGNMSRVERKYNETVIIHWCCRLYSRFVGLARGSLQFRHAFGKLLLPWRCAVNLESVFTNGYLWSN